MDDLISRQAAIAYAISGKTREFDGDKWIRVSEVRESLQTMPSAERRGRWVWSYEDIMLQGHYECSCCGWRNYATQLYTERDDFNYCPNCGARMVNEDE